MGTYDISRINFDAGKHYSSVRMQQGRVLTDDDWNEDKRIQEEELRRSRVDIIGPFGSPDAGFKIEAPKLVKNNIDFKIKAGTLHLGGLRLDLDREETYRSQKDWLQQPTQSLGDISGEVRYDLVYIEAWQQAVSAVEDESLFEVALGGPDTTTRLRNMRRIRIAANIGHSNCSDAWQEFKKDWLQAGSEETHNPYERITDAKLKVTVDKTGLPEDLCTPTAAGGYLGAENQAIRVQIVDQEHFTWGFDNASPLYRVTISVSDGESIVTMLTAPKDQCHWPLSGQVVEILPWSAVLPNWEKVAEETGHLTNVVTSYNPDSGEFTIANSLDPNFHGINWKTRSDKIDLKAKDDPDGQSPSEYYYLRVWNRGDDLKSDPEIKFKDKASVPLGNTGLEVAITGRKFFPGDYWVIAARPETPNQVVPWELEQGVAPHGTRRFYAPLAIIRWNRNDQEQIVGEVVHDCRKKFKPLTEQGCCCTYSVGDGKRSFGDFNSIQEAVDNLSEAGGKICILPGEHWANVKINQRQNIHISGCGERSLILPHPGNAEDPIFHIQVSSKIQIDHVSLFAPAGIAIQLSDLSETQEASRDITINDNHIVASVHAIRIQCQNEHAGNNNIHIAHNLVGMLNLPDSDGKAAIFSVADEVLIERNQVVLVSAPDPDEPTDQRPNDPTTTIFDPCWNRINVYKPTFQLNRFLQGIIRPVQTGIYVPPERYHAQGGIQIGDSSERVKIIGNKITGGLGHGVTLGSELMFEADGEDQKNMNIILVTKNPNFGDVKKDGHLLLSDINLEFKKVDDNTVYNVKTESGKYSLGDINPGNYEVSIETQGYEILNIYTEDTLEFGLKHIVEVETVEIEENCSFLYDISIDTNEITRMGSSGIGSFDFPDVMDNNVKVSIEDLTIYRNKIRHCAENVTLDNDTGGVIGGIVLGFCENCKILENRIEEYGNRAGIPFCGVFILYGEILDISSNYIISNEIPNGAKFSPRPGGGIFINMYFEPNFFESPSNQNQIRTVPLYGFPELRICNNVVSQSLGQALFLINSGSAYVVNNHFVSVGTDNSIHRSDLAATVFIYNLGETKYLPHKYYSVRNQTTYQVPSYNNNNPVSNGKIMFIGNQITHDMRYPTDRSSISSILVVSPGDIAFVNNQSECAGTITDELLVKAEYSFRLGNTAKALSRVNEVRTTNGDAPLEESELTLEVIYSLIERSKNMLKVNTILAGASIRTANNRFQDWSMATQLSLLSDSFMNTVIGNQATNCMDVQGIHVIKEQNIILYNLNDNECIGVGRGIRNSLGLR